MDNAEKIIRLENERLVVCINPMGAQLQSLMDKQTGKELLWQGNPAYWPGQAPVLFPIIGGMKDDAYTYKGTLYSMPRHGFAQNSLFSVEESQKESVSFKLSSNEQTKQFYPFDFLLVLTFVLNNNSLKLRISIKNTGDQPMFASLGWHPGFMLEGLNTGSILNDYSLFFGSDVNHATRIEIQKGFRSGRREFFPLQNGRMVLNNELFSKGPIVLTELNTESVEMQCIKGEHGFRMFFPGFPYLGIWTTGEPDKPFLCIEPWQGITDEDLPQKDFPAKEGIRVIPVAQELQSSIAVSIW